MQFSDAKFNEEFSVFEYTLLEEDGVTLIYTKHNAISFQFSSLKNLAQNSNCRNILKKISEI